MSNSLISSYTEFTITEGKKRIAPDYYITEIHSKNLLRNSSIRMNGYQFAFCLSGSVEMKVSGEDIHYGKGSFGAFSPYNTLEADSVSEDSCYSSNAFVVWAESFPSADGRLIAQNMPL